MGFVRAHSTMFQALLQAVRDGDRVAVKDLLDEGADVDYQGQEGMSALMLAARLNSVGIVRLLVGEGAQIDMIDDRGYTALLYAAENDRANNADVLLEAGADPDWLPHSGLSPVMVCFFGDSLETAEVLLIKGADVNLRTSTSTFDDFTALYLAARNGQLNFVRLFLLYGASVSMEVSSSKIQPLRGAALGNSPKIIELLLNYDADINHQDVDGWTALYAAAYFGNGAAIRALVGNGADTQLESLDGSTPLGALCDCTEATFVPSYCRTKACKSTRAMEELLA